MANADVEIGQVNMTMNFESEVAAPTVTGQARQIAADRARLKELLRPLILEVLCDEIDLNGRMRG
ncbi:hypothetical protein V1283_003353 [Bradyrhizobium sp. AZCC 2262]|uniref:hypothetical protein n=1 Tax=Bradyrhizobium sp. AZCC 2262 TaxID=3117022 RepID=UPI002FEE9A18